MYKLTLANGKVIGIADPDSCLRAARRTFDIHSEEWMEDDDESDYDEVIYEIDDPMLKTGE